MASVLPVLLVLCACASAASVTEYRINDSRNVQPITDLIKESEPHEPVSSQRAGRITQYQFKDCGGPTALVTVKSLTVGPDPVKLPGTLRIAGQMTATKSLDAPLVGNVTIEKKLVGKWVRIPCIDGVGSCNYDDLCDLLAQTTCPDPLVKIGIECQCPLFKPQDYSLPETEFDATFGPVPFGDYHLIGRTSVEGQEAFCIELYMSFA